MAQLKVPSISIVIGAGGIGGALGIGLTEKMYRLGKWMYSVISIDGVDSMLCMYAIKAREATKSLMLNDQELKRLEIIDDIIPEPRGGAHRDFSMQAASIDVYLSKSFKYLQSLSTEQLLENRWNKYKDIGGF